MTKNQLQKEVVVAKNKPENNDFDASDEVISKQELEKILEDNELNRNLVLMMALERPRKDNAVNTNPPDVIGKDLYQFLLCPTSSENLTQFLQARGFSGKNIHYLKIFFLNEWLNTINLVQTLASQKINRLTTIH